MKLFYSARFQKSFRRAPASVQKAFAKQANLLMQNLQHPSLRAKKYDETNNIWQARVNKDWPSTSALKEMNIGCTISWRIQNDRWASYKISIGLQIPLLLWLTGFSTLLGQIGFPTEVRPKSLFGFFGRSLTQCRAAHKS